MSTPALRLGVNDLGRGDMVIEYMEGHMNGRFHPALPGELVHHASSGQWGRLEQDVAEINMLNETIISNYKQVYARSIVAQDKLMGKINNYLEKNGQRRVDIGNDGDWLATKDRMNQAALALDKISSRRRETPGLTGRLRRGWSVLCENAVVGRVFVSIIPDDLMLASAVSGGLNVIFTALEQTAIHEAAVLRALEELPSVLKTHEAFAEASAQDVGIHEHTDELYVAVCQVLQYIIGWIMENMALSAAKRLFKGKQATENLGDMMAVVRGAAQRLEAYTIALIAKRHGESIGLQRDAMHMQGLMFVGQNMLNLQVHDMNAGLDQYFREQNARLQRLEELVQTAQATALGSLQPLLQGRYRELFLDHQVSHSRGPRSVSSEADTEDILKQLDFDPGLVPKDVDDLLRLGTPAMQHKIQRNRIETIHQSPRLRSWLYVDRSCLLAVHGNTSSSNDHSTSFVTATIVRSLARLASRSDQDMEVIPLAYFCGRHANFYRDRAAGAEALAGSLLLQLIAQHRGFHPRDLQRCLGSARDGVIEHTLSAFGKMIQRLPSRAMVYLVIDEIECFQMPPERKEGLWDVLAQIVGIFRERRETGSLGAKLKILVSTSSRSPVIEDLLEEEEIVNIPKDPPPGGSWSQVINARMLD